MSADPRDLPPLPVPDGAATSLESPQGPASIPLEASVDAPAASEAESLEASPIQPETTEPETASPATSAPEPGQLPERWSTIELGVDYGLDPNSIAADRVRAMIAAGIFSALALIVVVPVAVGWPAARLAAPLLWGLFVILLLGRAWWWPPVRHRHISYRLDAGTWQIRRGVWWRSVALVPRSRVQHTDVSQGPIERHFGLGTLIVHTAGTQFAAVPLSGLAHGTAMEIRDLLIDEPDGDDAV